MRTWVAITVLLCSPLAAQIVGGGGSGNAVTLQGVPVDSTAPGNGTCLVYSSSTGKWSASSCAGTASTAWSALTSGTNASAAMVVGTGASLAATGSGTITATSAPAAGLTGTVAVASGGTGASSLAGASIPVQSGTVTSGNCVKWSSGTAITDAGAPCGVATGMTFGSSDLPLSATAPTPGQCLYDNAGTVAGTACVSSAGGVGDWTTNGTTTLTGTAGAILDTSAAAQLLVPSGTAFASTAAGQIGFDTTGKNYHLFANGADAIIAPVAAVPATGDCAKYSVVGGNVLLADAGVACGSGGGGTSSGTNLVQVSNGTGGFISNTGLRANTTNGWLGIRNDTTAPTAALDMTWSGLADGSAGENLAVYSQTIASTSASPGNTHEINLDLTYNGSDAAFADTTDAALYTVLTDNRTPTAASTSGHELGVVSRLNFNGGANLQCIDGCGAFYGTAGAGGAGTTPTMFVYNADSGALSGTAVVTNWMAYNASLLSASGSPALDNVYGFLSGDPTLVTHGSGSGCVIAFAVSPCSGTNAWAFYSASTAPSSLHGALALFSNTPPAAGVALDAMGAMVIGSNSAVESDIQLRDYNNGTICCTLKMPLAGTGIVWKWPSDSGAFVATLPTAYNSATALSGNLAAQTLFAWPDSSARSFTVHISGACTTTSGSITPVLTYTNDVGAATENLPAQTCTASGQVLDWTASVYSKGSSNLAVATTTSGSPGYWFHAWANLDGANTFNSR